MSPRKGTNCKPVEPRFWANVVITPSCWWWTGAVRGKAYPYGTISVNGKRVPATWVSWELHHQQPWPAGMDACHMCDQPNCVNPSHLFPGTPSDNAKDAVRKGRVVTPTQRGFPNWQESKTHCVHGHQFTPENTYVTPQGRRRCWTCIRVMRPIYHAARKAREKLTKRSHRAALEAST